jgi:hypothetical protein
MDLSVTDQDLIVMNGGGSVTIGDRMHPHHGTGHQSHYPIWKDAEGNEYIYIDGHRAIEIGQTGLSGRREQVRR